MNKYIIQLVLLIGVVDQINGNFLITEVSTTEGAVEYLQIHKDMIPCAVAEGDMFYFKKVNDVIEIRCGEPPV
jgi:hypothetical protein